jgi:hypothetical protein
MRLGGKLAKKPPKIKSNIPTYKVYVYIYTKILILKIKKTKTNKEKYTCPITLMYHIPLYKINAGIKKKTIKVNFINL